MNQKITFEKIKKQLRDKPVLLAAGVIVTLGLIALTAVDQKPKAPNPVPQQIASVESSEVESAYKMPPEIAVQTLTLNSREPRKLVLPEFVPTATPEEIQKPKKAARWKENAVKLDIPEGMAKVVIIIDDVGMNYSAAKELNTMQGPLTIALLPYAAHVDTLAKEAREAGHELMIHMPMEPMDADLDTGPIVLKTGASSQEFDEMLDKALSSFEGYVGLNNHMGSKLTQDQKSMRHLMGRLAKEGMLFVDSRTIASSVAEETANEFGVPNTSRDVFLDDDPSAEAVHKSLMKVEQVARQYGEVVAIGHPKAETIKALQAWLPTLADKNMVLAPISAVIKPPEPTTNN